MGEYKGYTPAVKAAVRKYQDEKLDRVTVWLQKATAAEWRNHADLTGESLSAFVKRAVAEAMARDRAKAREALKNATREESEE